jgi:hypothetical protein
MTEETTKELTIDEQIVELQSVIAEKKESLIRSEAALAAIRGSLAGTQPEAGRVFSNPLHRVAFEQDRQNAAAAQTL